MRTCKASTHRSKETEMANFNSDGTPELTDEQRVEALAKAAMARHDRAELLRKVKEGKIMPENVLMRRDRLVMKTRVLRFIESWPGVGKATAPRLMEAFHIAKERRIGGLGPKQLAAMTEWLERRRAEEKADE